MKNNYSLKTRIWLTFAFLGTTILLHAQQVIGTYPSMNGGFEGISAGYLGTSSPSSWYSQSVNTANVVTTGGARSGNVYINCVQTGASAVKTLISPSVAGATYGSYTIQFYYIGDKDGTPNASQTMSGAYQIGTETKYGTWLNPANQSWTKYTINLTSTSGTGALNTWIRMNNDCSFDFDDFVIYAGAVDNTIPDAPTAPLTTPAATQIGLSWTAPVTGLDGGGYLVVRGTSDPTTAPLVNGIYALNNSMGSGTVVYIGTTPSFTDTGLSENTHYYYRIYTVDKAFNYSTALTADASTTLASFASEPMAQVSDLNFSGVNQSEMTINWKPAVADGGSNHLVVVKAASDLSATPADGSSYTANAVYGLGAPLGGGFVVYSGSGNSVSVTGLNVNTTYYVKVYDFNGSLGTENYLTTLAPSANKTTNRKLITSAVSGAWASGSTWVGGVKPTQEDNVLILAGHVITYTGISANACYNLNINSGGQLYNITGAPTYSVGYMGIYGNSLQVDGTFGDATTEYVSAIQFNQNCTLSGTGIIKMNRIRPYANVTNATFTFDANASITNTSTAMLFDNSGNSNIGYVVNSAKIVEVSGQVLPVASSSLTVDGTLTMLSGSNADFSNANVSGGGTFNLNAGATLKIGAADGLKASTGSVRCATRNFNAAANYQFTGSVPQTSSGDFNSNNDFPSQVNNLTINNASGVTMSGDITVNGSLQVNTGVFNTSLRSLFVKGNVSGSGSVDATSGTLYFYGSSEQTFSSTISGQVSVSPSSKVTNTGIISNGSSLYLNSDIGGTGTFINKGSASFSVSNIQQYLKNSSSWCLSSPIIGSVISTSPFQNIDTYYEYIESGNNTDQSVPGSSSYLKGYGSPFPMTIGKGYICHSTAASTLGFAGYDGLNDAVSYQIPVTRTGSGSQSGFNLVGNPYTAYISWDSIVSDVDNGAISTTFWSQTRNTLGQDVFSTYNASSGFFVLGNAGIVMTSFIPPMQGFWIRVRAGHPTANLSIKKTMLSHKDVSGNIFKSPLVLNNAMIRLQVSNGTNSDETLIYGHENALNSFDDYDSPKMSLNKPDMPEIYSISGDEKLVINGLQSVAQGTVIPLGFVTGESNSFSLKLSELKNLDPSLEVVLKDNLVPVEQVMAQGDVYNFISDVASTADRFSLLIRTATVTGWQKPSMVNHFGVYSLSAKRIVVDMFKDYSGALAEVYNLAGVRIATEHLTGSRTILQVQSGAYLVRIIAAKKTELHKVIVK